MASIIKVDTIQDQDGNNIINENANTITIGKSGDTVQVAAGAEFVGGGIQWQSTIVTGTTLSAVAGNGYWIDTTSNACTVTLPASASVGDTIEFVDYARTWNTNAITINPNSLNYQGNSSPNPEYNTDGQHVKIVYSGATQGWIPTTDDDVSLKTPQAYTIDYLVIAGGGGGGFDAGGGGGAGGYRNSYSTESSGGGGSSETGFSTTSGTVFTVTVGAGGAKATGQPSTGSFGSDSSISAPGFTTVTSAGGGGGASQLNNTGKNGGSGGGGSRANSGSGGSGTANQGFDGGSGQPSPANVGGGGGGAGSAGQSASHEAGDGLNSSITGTSVGRGGGAYGYRGAGDTPVTPFGGGGGGSPGADGTDGTTNKGGGGGGGGSSVPQTGGNGGSGVVILRMPTADYSGTTSGSPTVTTSGSDTILTFNSSGSYTS